MGRSSYNVTVPAAKLLPIFAVPIFAVPIL